MPEAIITLRTDPRTGRKTVVVQYQSDEDALPMEHESAHRQLVDQLLNGGALNAAEIGDIIIERLADEGTATVLAQPVAPGQSIEHEEG